jgi:VanZ family protein
MSAKSILKICGVAVLVLLLLFAALGPGKWQVRTGLGWQFDHVAGYFAFTLMFALACRRPLVVGGILMASAMLLEALQALTPDRSCDLQAAFYGAGGALAGALFADLSNRTLRQLNRLALLVPQVRIALWNARQAGRKFPVLFHERRRELPLAIALRWRGARA